MATIRDILKNIQSKLYLSIGYSTDEAKLEARFILEHALKITQKEIIQKSDEDINTDNQTHIEYITEKRMGGRPLPYLLGEWAFYGRTFKVNPHVLIPRADTETLIETGLSKINARDHFDILDLGCGTGIIGITIALERPLSKVTLIDQSEDAIKNTKENQSLHQVTNTMIQKSDLFIQKRSQLINLIYDINNNDYWQIESTKFYVKDYIINNIHSVNLNQSDIVVSLRLDDFIQLTSKTSDIIPPQYYIEILEKMNITNEKVYIVCEKSAVDLPQFIGSNKLGTPIKAFDNIHNMQKQIQELASLAIDKPNTINNHNLNNNSNNKMIDNRVLNMIPLDLDQENLKKTLEEKFTENHLINGQKGVAQFFVDHYLVTEDKKYMIKCTDPSRKMFIYLDNEGKIHKDVNGFKFTKNISDPVIEVTHNMLNELPEKYPDDNGRIDYATIKFMEIANIKHDNNEFIKNLFPPLITKN